MENSPQQWGHHHGEEHEVVDVNLLLGFDEGEGAEANKPTNERDDPSSSNSTGDNNEGTEATPQMELGQPDPYASKVKQAGAAPAPAPSSPGVVLAAGCGFPFKNPDMQTQLRRLHKLAKELDPNNRFLLIPMYALHVTIATPLKYKVDGEVDPEVSDVAQSWTREVATNRAFREEVAKGPIRLLSRHLELRGGNAIVLMLEDVDGRIGALRDCVRGFSTVDMPKAHIPDIFHCTVARLAEEADDELRDGLPTLLASWTPTVVELDTVDLVLEKQAVCMLGFPSDVLVHLDCDASSTQEVCGRGLGEVGVKLGNGSSSKETRKGFEAAGGERQVEEEPGESEKEAALPLFALGLVLVAAVVAGLLMR